MFSGSTPLDSFNDSSFTSASGLNPTDEQYMASESVVPYSPFLTSVITSKNFDLMH